MNKAAANERYLAAGLCGGQTWLAGLNDKFYFPAVALINGMIVVWFFHLAKSEVAEPAWSSDSSEGRAS